MNDLRELYQEVIMDHNKNPRNFHKLEHANRRVEGRNPLCGDHYTIYMIIENNIIKEVTFEGAGCAISKASASIMSTVLKGKSVEQAKKLFHVFHEIVTGSKKANDNFENLGKLAAFSGVSEFPIRVKCASLAWHAMHSGLSNKDNIVSTEENQQRT